MSGLACYACDPVSGVRAHVLSIQDNETDTRLLQETWGKDPEIRLTCRGTAALGLEHLQTEDQLVPNLILLAGRFPLSQLPTLEVMHALKADPQLRCIPVIVFSGGDPATVQKFYDALAACVIAMPRDLPAFEAMLVAVKAFWLSIARLPRATTRVYHAADTSN